MADWQHVTKGPHTDCMSRKTIAGQTVIVEPLSNAGIFKWCASIAGGPIDIAAREKEICVFAAEGYYTF